MGEKKKGRGSIRPVVLPPKRMSGSVDKLLIPAALLLLTAAAFFNSFDAGFTLDNKGILRDPRVAQVTTQNVSLIFQHTYWWPSGEAGLYRPFTTLTYLLNYAIFGNGADPAGYHWINLALHGCNVLLVFFLMLRLIGDRRVAGFIAAVWAVHPVLTESVTNIVGRADLLAGCATLGGFLMYLKSVETTGWSRARWLLGLTIITAIGVFSKESAVCIVGIILLYELAWWDQRRHPKFLLFGCLATLAPVCAMLYQRSTVLAASLPAEFPFVDNPIIAAGFWSARLTAIKVLARYLWLMLWPSRLSCDYSYAEIPVIGGSVGDWLACIAVLCVGLLAALAYRRNRFCFFMAGFAAVTFLPASNLLFPIGTIMAERFLYLPSIGLLACMVVVLFAAAKRASVPQSAELILCVVVAALAIRTVTRNADWKNDLTVVTSSLESSPHSFKLHKALAEQLYGSERTPESMERGEQETEKSIAILDTLSDSQNQGEVYCLAGAYLMVEGERLSAQPLANPRGQTDLSPVGEQMYKKGIQRVLRCAAIDKTVRAVYLQKLTASASPRQLALKPAAGDPQPYLMLADAYFRLHEVDSAVKAARQALDFHPRSPAGYQEIANIFLLNGREEDASAALLQGMLLTSDASLASALLRLYQRDPRASGCSLLETKDAPGINPQCEPYRERACTISGEIIKARLQNNRLDLAEQQRRTFIEDYRCSPALLDPLLPGHKHS